MSRRYLKKSHDKKITGVCAGIAEYFGWSHVQVRLLFVLFTILGGAGILLYVILSIVMPPPDSEPPSSFDLDDFHSN